MKKLLSWALAFAIMVSMVPAALADNEGTDPTYNVTINVNKDGAAWENHGKTITLKDASDESAAAITDLTTVPAGTYQILVDGEAIQTVTVVNANTTATLDYYTVTYNLTNTTSDTFSISAKYLGTDTQINSEDTVLKDKGIAVEVTGGAEGTTYNYAWTENSSNKENTTNLYTINAVQAKTEIVCTVSAQDTTKPTLESAVLNGSTVTLTYNEVLTENYPAAAFFKVWYIPSNNPSAIEEITVQEAWATGKHVYLKLSEVVETTDIVYLAYTIDTTKGYTFIKDLAGNMAENINQQTLTNKTGTCGNNVKWSYANGALSFTGTGAMEDYESRTCTPWHALDREITSISIANGITHIGSRTMTFNKATSVSIPASVTSVGECPFGFGSIRTIKFLGNAPKLVENVFDSTDGIQLTVQYPANDSTWNPVIGKNYSERTTVTWVPYGNSNSSNSSSSSSSGASSSSNTTTETVKNPNGSTTTTVTDKKTGEVTETTKTTTGTTTTIVTDKNGNVTETKVSLSSKDASSTGTVTLPMDDVKNTSNSSSAQEIDVVIPKGQSVKVEVPVKNATAGTVVIVVDKDGNETIIPTTQLTENGVSVTLDSSSTIKIVDNSKTFNDVPSDNVFRDEIAAMSARNIMVGKSDETFDLYSEVTLNQIVNVAGRISGNVAVTDYEGGVNWGAEQGLPTGDQPATRGNVLSALYLAAGSPDTVDYGKLSQFKDADQIPTELLPAILWAVENGIIKGNPDGTLGLDSNVTRGQAAAFAGRALSFMA